MISKKLVAGHALFKALAGALACVSLAIPGGAQSLTQWRYYTAIQLDTTANGANISGDVHNFPLAVTLNAQILDWGCPRLRDQKRTSASIRD